MNARGEVQGPDPESFAPFGGMPVVLPAHLTVNSVGDIDANVAKFQDALKGVKIWTPDWAQVLKDLPADVKRWHEVTGS